MHYIILLLGICLSLCGCVSDTYKTNDDVQFQNNVQLKQFNFQKEFEVDLEKSEPIYKATRLTLSGKDTYKISLKTLSHLQKATPFPLVQADEIIQDGLPKVIPPKGYSVTLNVENHQLIAVIKSIDPALDIADFVPIPIQTETPDIIVGDIQPSLTVMETSFVWGSFQRKLIPGLQADVHEDNQTYGYTCQNGEFIYMTIFGNTAAFHKLHTTVGKQWNFHDYGKLSAQLNCGIHSTIRSNVYSGTLMYSLPQFHNMYGQILLSGYVNRSFQQIFGIGITKEFSNNNYVYSQLTFNKTLWRWALNYRIEF